MSGECQVCGEHCLECKCDFKIRVWAQMFFEDGSVTEGIRVGAEVFDNESNIMKQIAVKLLESVNRHEGFLLVWGAGEMFNRYYYLPTSFSSQQAEESGSSA